MTTKIYGNRWESLGPIGKGGQGQVLKVADLRDTTFTGALKRLWRSDRKKLERFRREIEVVQTLDHNGIVKIVDFDLDSKEPFLVTEYYELGELSISVLNSLSPVAKLELFKQICEAVGHAHNAGVIHRDLKPPNILMTSQSGPIVADFGICFNSEDGLDRLTENAEQVGARFYMAPELAHGRADEITPSSDVYSLGKLLYWIFAGRIFDREVHMQERWDIRPKDSEDHTIHFLYEILNQTIIYEPHIRYENANILSEHVQELIEVVAKNGHYLDISLPQRCLFCRKGLYQLGANSPNRTTDIDYWYQQIEPFGLDLRKFANPNSAYPRLLVLACSYCGNVQTFRTDLSHGGWRGLDQ